MSNKCGPGFHHVAFSAHDFDKTISFYEEAFGYKVGYSWGSAPKRAAMIDIGSGDYVEVFEGAPPPAERGEGVLAHFAIRVPSTDESFARAVAAGAAVHQEPKDVLIQGSPPVKVRIAFVKGPDNEIVEFFENDQL